MERLVAAWWRVTVGALVLVVLVVLVAAAPSVRRADATGASGCETSGVTLRVGSRGADVVCVQRALVARGVDPGPVDGIFGSVTRRAVVAFQRAAGLYVDGVVGPQTGGRLGIWPGTGGPVTASPPAPAVPASAPRGEGCETSGAMLRVGSRGADVVCVQRALVARGVDPGPVDGIFGSVTRRAVVAFQRAAGLYVDGVVGPQTGGRLGIWPGTGPARCDLEAARQALSRRPDAGQVVVVRADGPGASTARIDVVEVVAGELTPVSCGLDARVGRSGVRAPRVDGDGSTPGGVFGLGTVTAPDGQVFSMFGTADDPGVTAPYRTVRPGDCWSLQPYTTAYNRLVAADEATCRDRYGNGSEYLPAFGSSYRHAALIDYNLGPDRSGDAPGEVLRGGAIFLHHHTYDAAGQAKATSGCVSLGLADLLSVLRWLDPSRTPVFAITVAGLPPA